MIITNKTGLPAPFVNMATREYTYTPKRYSATSLLKPIREILLTRRHNDEIEQDCADMIWMLFGQAVHAILEKNADAGDIAEKKFAIELGNGYTISGIIDYFESSTKTVIDYKTASAWKVIYGDFSDWERQGLIYAWLMAKSGGEVNEVKFYALLKDWSKTESKRKADYPKQPVYLYKFTPTPEKLREIENYIYEKIADLILCEPLPDSELPLCPAVDRWNDGDKYAVMKNGRKTAVRVLDSLAEAEDYKAANGGDYIETRPGVDRKCADYCACCAFCDYWQKNYREEKISD
jgi:hypothetical protein